MKEELLSAATRSLLPAAGRSYLGHVAGAGETKRHRADGFGHEPHGYHVPTIPHCLDGLADVPVVVRHADVLWTAEGDDT